MTPPEDGERSSALDHRRDGRVLLATAGALLVAFSVGAVLQTVFVFRPERLDVAALVAALPEVSTRLLANLLTVAGMLVACAILRPDERGRRGQVLIVVVVSLVASFARLGLQVLLGIYPTPTPTVVYSEVLTVFVVGVISLVLALVQVGARKRLRRQERASAEQELRAAAALAALASEELRVRREVAEGLHGTLQNQLVLVEVQIDAILERARAGRLEEGDLELLARARADLDEIRERDVRELSQLLYPAGVDLGIAHALRLLVRRVPATIETEILVDERLGSAAEPDALGTAQRVALVRAAEEGITNALRHGRAGRIRIGLAIAEADAGPVVELVVEDDGLGLGREEPRWNGLARSAERVESIGGALSLTERESGGTRLSVSLPLR